MQIITGYTGENHVTSADDASLYRGILGQDDYVLDVGNKFEASIIDNNTVRIMDGDLVIQGHQARIRANDYNEVTIDNGTPGEKRNDLIVARYQKNTITGIESISLAVVKGTPGPTAVDPEIVQEDLKTGGTQRDFALYRVSLDGLVLESVTSLFTTIPNLKVLKTHLADYESYKNNIMSRDVLWQGSAGEDVALQLIGNAEDYAFIVFYTSSEVTSSAYNGIAFGMPGVVAYRLASTYGNTAANFRYDSSTNSITVYHFSNASMRVKKVEGVVKVR